MVKICYVIGTLEVGGAEKQLYLLIRDLNKKKFEPVLIALRDGRMRQDFEKIVKLHVIGKKWKIDIVFLLKLIQIMRLERPHILHASMFTSNLWGRLAACINRVPVIIASELSMDLWKTSFHLFFDRILAWFTRKIICNSQEVERRYRKSLGRYGCKLSVIYNGIDIAFYDSVEDKQAVRGELGISREKVILTGGRLCAEKGLDYFLKAASIVVKVTADVKFLIVGEGDKKKSLLEMAEKLELNEHVVFTGYRKDLPDIIKISDVVVLSSLWEGMPNLLIEAMALRKPVIGTNVGGTIEIVKDGETGFLVPAKDPEMLAGAMLCLLKDKVLRERMGNKGYEFVKEKLSLQKMVKKYEELYEELTGVQE
ncbi:MAG TPA: glycosyltransferase [bacterium]|nr:glycosyltransferase [bacterium]